MPRACAGCRTVRSWLKTGCRRRRARRSAPAAMKWSRGPAGRRILAARRRFSLAAAMPGTGPAPTGGGKRRRWLIELASWPHAPADRSRLHHSVFQTTRAFAAGCMATAENPRIRFRDAIAIHDI